MGFLGGSHDMSQEQMILFPAIILQVASGCTTADENDFFTTWVGNNASWHLKILKRFFN